MSTLISKRQREHVDALVSAAVDAGATRLSGGAPATWEPLDGGAFYQPTVLADVEDDNPAAMREAFGPMASLLKFDTVDEALARANASEFGLSSQVWGNNARAIQYLTQNLEAGAVWVNTYRAAHPTLRSAGMKTQRLRARVRLRSRLGVHATQVRDVGSHIRAFAAVRA